METRDEIEKYYRDYLPELTSKAFDPNHDHYWEKVSPEELLWHTFEAHCNSYSTSIFGVPNFDLEIAAQRKISLKPLVAKIYAVLIEPLDLGQFDSFRLPFQGDSEAYRIELVKILQFIEQLEPGIVDWNKVYSLSPNFQSVKFNYQEDCRDISFTFQLKTRQQLAQALSESIGAWFQSI